MFFNSYTKINSQMRGDCIKRLPTSAAYSSRNLSSKRQEQWPYLTIEDLFEMFAGKPKRTDFLCTRYRTKKDARSPCVSYQIRITSSFRPTANKNALISQGSKSSKSKSFAEAVRNDRILKIHGSATYHTKVRESEQFTIMMSLISRCPSSSFISPASLNFSGSSHICRICSGIIGSKNGLHCHLRSKHSCQALRDHQGKLQKPSTVTISTLKMPDRNSGETGLTIYLLLLFNIRFLMGGTHVS